MPEFLECYSFLWGLLYHRSHKIYQFFRVTISWFLKQVFRVLRCLDRLYSCHHKKSWIAKRKDILIKAQMVVEAQMIAIHQLQIIRNQLIRFLLNSNNAWTKFYLTNYFAHRGLANTLDHAETNFHPCCRK